MPRYLIGPVGLTMTYHQPRNLALAKVDPGSSDGASYWERYVREWTRWNHVRVAVGLAGAAALTEALHVG